MKSFVLFLHQSMGISKPIFVRYVFAELGIRIRGAGFGIRCLLNPGSGIQDGYKISNRVLDEQPGSYFRELKKQFFGLKYLNSLMWIRDPGWKKSRIRDPG
jgi:hypothetical protein